MKYHGSAPVESGEDRKPHRDRSDYRRRAVIATAATAAAVGTAPYVADAVEAVKHKLVSSDRVFNPDQDVNPTDARITKNNSRRNETVEKLASYVCRPVYVEGKPNIFEFKPDQGEDAAVVKVKGSGEGSADPCWDETKAIVHQELRETHADYREVRLNPDYVPGPQPGDRIELPDHMEIITDPKE